MLWLLLGCIDYRITISPLEPTTGDTLFVGVQTDDDTTVNIANVGWYKWYTLTVEARELSLNWTARGEDWVVEVTLDDGKVLNSEAVTIANSLPDVTLESFTRSSDRRVPRGVSCDHFRC